MKSILFSLFLILCAAPLVRAQDMMDQLPILILPTDSGGKLTAAQTKLIDARIQRLVTANGLSAEGSTQFAIRPEVIFINTDEIPGLETTYEVELELHLSIAQRNSQVVFSDVAIPLDGMAYDERRAVDAALKGVRSSNAELRDFLRNGKAKIMEYYAKQCTNIQGEAYRAYQLDNFVKALAMLYSIPKETPCFQESLDMLGQVYEAYQDKFCEKWLQRARAARARNDYAAALSAIQLVDPQSSCGFAAQELIDAVAGEVDADRLRYWNEARRRFDVGAELEAIRLQTIGQMVQSYYSRPEVNQVFIVR